jgi:uncharacterized protein YbjT (DUF2867 family)
MGRVALTAVAVVGGTGTFGALAAAEFARRGHQTYVLSRRPPAGAGPPHRHVDLATGDGLYESLLGIDVVVDASNATRPGTGLRRVLIEGTRRQLDAETRAGVARHVLISVVGVEAVPFYYYAAKLEQERCVREAPVPTTIIRSTQFHQLLDRAFTSTARLALLPAAHFPLQPIDAREAAAMLVNAVEDEADADAQIAGPQIASLAELAHIWRTARGRRPLLVPVPLPGTAGRALRAGAFTAPAAMRGSCSFSGWLQGRETARPRWRS